MGEFIPYPAIERHGVVGDRRTAALIAADGTVDWFCGPDYDGHVIFGALVDARRGGFWRVGPSTLAAGEQSYPTTAPFLQTRWCTSEYDVDLLDAMTRPHEARETSAERTRTIVRRLRCSRGKVECISACAPSFDFQPTDRIEGTFASGDSYALWASDERLVRPGGSIGLSAGDAVWLAFTINGVRDCAANDLEALLQDAEAFWRRATAALGGEACDPQILRSATTIRLLEYAPAGSIVAAPTTSLPERIGGSWNADYRLTWVRDASLSMATLARLGDVEAAGRFLRWLVEREAPSGAPLQVAYGVKGETALTQRSQRKAEGYRGSTPVRIGNHAYRQRQLDMFGYLADCALVFLDCGGAFDSRLWRLIARAAGYVCDTWRRPDNGIWELPVRQRYVSSRVMAWTTLDRALRIADRLGTRPPDGSRWRTVQAEIRADVETNGWSDTLRAFRQSDETDALDASALLIPIVGFLPPSDARVISTVERIAERLTIDGCVYRFDPALVPRLDGPPMGQYEGAFLPCTFWLASAYALLGRQREAAAILRRVRAVSGSLGLLAEGLDPRTSAFLGNTPLLFSHVEHIRAVQALSSKLNVHTAA